MIELSIILPCYNVEVYLERCFNSIYTQEVDYNFEVIAVDDASTDNTLEVLTQFAQKYKNLVIIHHEENRKLTGARTSGIKAARGRYILHVDPDDALLPDSLQRIFRNRGVEWDILFFNVLCESTDNRKSYQLYTSRKEQIFNLKNSKDQSKIFKLIKGSCFAKIVKRELCDNLLYFNYNYNIGEDFAFNYEVFNRATIVVYDPHLFYSYFFNSNSLARGKFNVDRLNYENSWVCNIVSVTENQPIYKISNKTIICHIERYSIGLLLITNSMSGVERHNIYNLWKKFFSKHVLLFGSLKSKWYFLLLKFNNERISIPLFLISLGQIAPYMERLKRQFLSK
jgi:glycosyltransferase involved in cell wall biosynthesis